MTKTTENPIANYPTAQESGPKRIPYGIADYRRMWQENAYYVDKTHYIPMIEAAPFYLFCIRPRRIGKSLWLSLLDHYYDINREDEFDFLFGNTYIGQNPTPTRNSYLTMFFNFAMVRPEPDKVETSFHENGYVVVQKFLARYERFFDEEKRRELLALKDITAQLRRIFAYADLHDLKIYLFIDEYDNFTNTILSNYGQESYYDITQGVGFFRHFFNLLKGATGGQISGLSRLYMTGVSPVTMDDVTSGFNIGTNISLDGRFNEMVGLTEDEIRTMLTHYRMHEILPLDVEETMDLMKVWYNNYFFGPRAKTSMFNSDMVFHFLLKANADGGVPDEIIDQNIRIDYNKLRHLMAIDNRLNGNFSQLRRIVEEGSTASLIHPSFPLDSLLERENFISLLYYFGLLSIAGSEQGKSLLRIPNRGWFRIRFTLLIHR